MTRGSFDRLRGLSNPAHPLHGSGSASYALQLAQPYKGRMWLVVEVPNAWAIATIELLWAGQRAREQPEWRVVSVFESGRSPKVDLDLVIEISWVEFVIDFVEPAELIANIPVAHSFARSVRGAAKRHALEKIASALELERQRPRDNRRRSEEPQAAEPVAPSTLDTAWVGSLTARWARALGRHGNK